MSDDGDVDAAYTQALELGALGNDTFGLGRTELLYGERLRRMPAGAATHSRHLRRALDLFERLGAEPWAARTRQELRASGAQVATGDAPRLHDLTPQELQVALLSGGGATNREAAAQLFLSPKTIDYHLRNVYRKLGVRSRVELARALATAQGD